MPINSPSTIPRFVLKNRFLLLWWLPTQQRLPSLMRCEICSTMMLWKCGWKRYTEPSTATVTLSSLMRLRSTATPAAAKYAARLETHSQTWRTLAQSPSVASLNPNSSRIARQLLKSPGLSLREY